MLSVVAEKETGVPSLCVRGKMSFDDFVQVTCLFSTYTRDEILRCENAAASLSVCDCCALNDALTPGPTHPSSVRLLFAVAFDAFDTDHSGDIDAVH